MGILEEMSINMVFTKAKEPRPGVLLVTRKGGEVAFFPLDVKGERKMVFYKGGLGDLWGKHTFEPHTVFKLNEKGLDSEKVKNIKSSVELSPESSKIEEKIMDVLEQIRVYPCDTLKEENRLKVANKMVKHAVENKDKLPMLMTMGPNGILEM